MTEEKGLANIIGEYFKEMFKSTFVSGHINWAEELSIIQPKITEEMNDNLIRDVSKEEIRQAIFHI
ncbi:hypothetical protein QQ045_013258 [Rhodiola kirilowii]